MRPFLLTPHLQMKHLSPMGYNTPGGRVLPPFKLTCHLRLTAMRIEAETSINELNAVNEDVLRV